MKTEILTFLSLLLFGRQCSSDMILPEIFNSSELNDTHVSNSSSAFVSTNLTLLEIATEKPKHAVDLNCFHSSREMCPPQDGCHCTTLPHSEEAVLCCNVDKFFLVEGLHCARKFLVKNLKRTTRVRLNF